MFYLLHGQDTYRSRNKLNELISHFKTKVSGLGFFDMDKESFSEADFEELLKTKNLFERKYVTVCRRLLEDKISSGFIIKNLELCAGSENIFLFWEGDLEQELVEAAEKRAVKTQKFDLLDGTRLAKWYADKKLPVKVAEAIKKECGADLSRAEKEIEKYELGDPCFGDLVSKTGGVPAYNPFAICDAFAEKNKMKAWIIYHQALRQGVSAEEVFFKIAWQIKNLLLVKGLQKFGSPNMEKSSGLHPFVFKKTLRAAQNFTEGELEKYSYEMLKIYHEERRGRAELSVEFEKMLIS
ncbi:TPA: hypothetical protein DEW47_01305 [Patescibacteria group bacterium]|nr:MAG: polymerase III, delta subunit protein [Parcubacteria group bacterium GW2011_GWF2_40_10]KKR47935.1 MAG: polymerase III, delta subunit protein [Parcubacteria group bacterium GW2011_GWA2_40_143]KKR60383.1 MAG: polymerase III, delta subunit protein [Parcubacteria group bacterium GW2011_GWC2_40_31]KKR75271.1 MAG: polymerase III, delta subunit protein [Parcubacteria group bacterium GW2011_GWB2_40_8]KKR80306.1 MAG: polymerase III, delta subunit protein [Parcubacteria group bacterium GW2011_GWD